MQLEFFDIATRQNSYGQLCYKLSGKEFLTPDEFGRAIRVWSDKNLNIEIKTLGLFSGAGGLDIGFHDSGFKILETVESRFARELPVLFGSKSTSGSEDKVGDKRRA